MKLNKITFHTNEHALRFKVRRGVIHAGPFFSLHMTMKPDLTKHTDWCGVIQEDGNLFAKLLVCNYHSTRKDTHSYSVVR